MAQPATGTEWGTGGFADVDSRFVQRGGLVAALIRDYQGADTDISPATFNPFALDGKLRDDLFAVTKVDGVWTENQTANQGWWFTGANTEDGGPNRKPSVSVDDLMILQSNYPIDSDITKEEKTVSFTAVESAKPLIHRLRLNKPLIDDTGAIIVEDPGTADYFAGKPVEADFVERQLLLIRKRTKAGLPIYTVEGYPLVKLSDIGAAKMSKKDPDAAELSWKVLPDPFFVDVDGTPLVEGVWMGGEGWTSISPGS
jgi:hypothetical protein